MPFKFQPGITECPCGHIAVRMNCGEPACQRCLDWESRSKGQHAGHQGDLAWRRRVRLAELDSGLPVYHVANPDLVRAYGL